VSSYERRLVVLLSLGGFFEFYDLLFSAYVAPGLVREGILTTTGIASFVSALFIGLFIGTATCGFLADRFGRRAIFTISLLWYSAATFAMAMQAHVFGLYLCRLLAGIGLGVEMITIDTYISELVPKQWRGRAMALNQTIQFSAVPVAALLAWLLVPRAPLGIDGWRWVVLFGSAGALVVWQIRRQLPESPRWSSTDVRPSRPWRELRRPPYTKRTIMLIVFNVFQTVGYYGFSAWAPTLLIQRGITISTSLQYTFIIAIAAPFGPVLAGAIADRTERKSQIIGAALAIAVFGLLFAQMTSAVLIVLLGAAVTLANNVMSIAFHAYQAELYPTRIRAFAVGLVYSWSRLSVVFSSFAIGFTLRAFGVTGVFILIAGSMAVVIAAIGAMGPRTTNLALEEISK
jgi:putative MFS transporter